MLSHQLEKFSFRYRSVFLFLVAVMMLFSLVAKNSAGSAEEKTLSSDQLLHDDHSESLNGPIPQFASRKEVEHVNCKRIFDGDKVYTNRISKQRLKLRTYAVNMSCDAVRERVIGKFPSPNVDYPIAFAKAVFKDYEFLELQLAVSYSEENQFCFTVDSKAHYEFHNKIKRLEECLPNVYVARDKYKLDSAGHNMNRAHMDCMKILLENGKWNYVLLLQNHDVILHTNAELVGIFNVLNGANLMAASPLGKKTRGRFNPSLRWDPESLQMFRNNSPLNETERKNTRLEFTKGPVAMCLTNEAADWTINKMNFTKMVNQLNAVSYGVDEQLFPTLYLSESLKMPGGYHSACLRKKKRIEGYTRNIAPHYISINKMMPDSDYAAISCVAERLFNRTHFDRTPTVDTEFFASLPVVKYQTIKAEPNFNPSEYQC